MEESMQSRLNLPNAQTSGGEYLSTTSHINQMSSSSAPATKKKLQAKPERPSTKIYKTHTNYNLVFFIIL